MSDQSFEAFGVLKILHVTEGILRGEVGIIEGCRLISSYSADLEETDRGVFLPFIGVDSETEDFPLGRQRELWNAESLARKDHEREEYLREITGPILEASRELVVYLKRRVSDLSKS